MYKDLESSNHESETEEVVSKERTFLDCIRETDFEDVFINGVYYAIMKKR